MARGPVRAAAARRLKRAVAPRGRRMHRRGRKSPVEGALTMSRRSEGRLRGLRDLADEVRHSVYLLAHLPLALYCGGPLKHVTWRTKRIATSKLIAGRQRLHWMATSRSALLWAGSVWVLHGVPGRCGALMPSVHDAQCSMHTHSLQPLVVAACQVCSGPWCQEPSDSRECSHPTVNPSTGSSHAAVATVRTRPQPFRRRRGCGAVCRRSTACILFHCAAEQTGSVQPGPS